MSFEFYTEDSGEPLWTLSWSGGDMAFAFSVDASCWQIGPV